MLIAGDCLEQLRVMPENSLDSLVTDPPAGISFMGKEWDDDRGGRDQWIEWMTQVMKECLRVLKPGAHGLVWALPRTSHWTASALEDAGFEIRDVITHLFGSGFPKSHDISKAIDKSAGAERIRVPIIDISTGKSKTPNIKGGVFNNSDDFTALSSEAITPEAKLWQGWGTALKPSVERWLMVRKPLTTVPLDHMLRDICRKLRAKFVNLNSELSQKESSVEFDFAQWHAVEQTILKSLEELEKTDTSKSLVMVKTISNIVMLWSAFLDVLCELPSKSIIEIETALIIDLKILNCLISVITLESTILDVTKEYGSNSHADTVDLLLREIQTQLLMLGRHFVQENASTLAGHFAKQTKELLELESEMRSAGWSEDIILVRKPCSEKTVAANVLRFGTGGINVDASRIAGKPRTTHADGNFQSKTKNTEVYGEFGLGYQCPEPQGRFPANLLFSHNPDCVEVGVKKVKLNGSGVASSKSHGFQSEYVGGDKKAEGFEGGFTQEKGTETVWAFECTEGCAVAALDRQGIGYGRSSGNKVEKIISEQNSLTNTFGKNAHIKPGVNSYSDSGNVSRFFYCAKPSKREKNLGCEGLEEKQSQSTGWSGDSMPLRQDGTERKMPVNKNIHPTVKSTKLMSYLINMITPPDGTVLDPFCGSGSTGVAAYESGFEFVGIEQNPEYLQIASKRIQNARKFE